MTSPTVRQFNCLEKCLRMPNQSVLVLGNLPADLAMLDRVAVEFGWSLKKAANFDALRRPSVHRDAVAVLFEASMWSLSWQEVLEMVIDAAPAACPILCHRLSASLDWPELSAAGAFHALAIPIHEREARQSLGFACAAQARP